ncbi:unnamed protein product [Rhodiola kirilowii]
MMMMMVWYDMMMVVVVAGLLAGVATVAIGHPFDTIKVKLQKHNTGADGIKYKNALHCTARILQSEGVKGLYRGATSSFVGVAFESSLLFGIYSQTKQKLQLIRGESHNGRPQLQVIIPSASFGGAIISFVLCPSELVKCRMQVQGTDSHVPKSSRYSGPLDCTLKIIKDEGVKGIFRGGLSTFFRESIGNAAFFIAYENRWTWWCSFLVCCSSLGCCKDNHSNLPDKDSSRNPLQILNTIYKRTGIRGCYTGLGPTILRAFPANAAAIVTWELAVKLLGIRHD